jgi:hypothetical protein
MAAVDVAAARLGAAESGDGDGERWMRRRIASSCPTRATSEFLREPSRAERLE